MRKGPDEVGNVIRLGGLEGSTPRIPVAASAFVVFASRFPFVFLRSPDKRLCHIFAKVDGVTYPVSIHIDADTLVTRREMLSGLVPAMHSLASS